MRGFLALLAAVLANSGTHGVRVLKRRGDPKAKRSGEASSGSRRAIVSLLYGASSPSVMMLRTTLNSARRHGSTADRLAMIPQGDPALKFRGFLESAGIQIVEVPGMGAPPSMSRSEDAAHWQLIFTKFMAFNLTQYDKVLLIDNDAFFAGQGNPDEIFEECDPHELCLVVDAMPELYAEEDCPDEPHLCQQMNTGVMVLTPSQQRLGDIMDDMGKDPHQYHFPDQQWFSRYLWSRKESMSWKLLDKRWNGCGHGAPADFESRIWVGHFCQSWVSGKCYTTRFCTETDTSCSTTLRKWQLEVLAADQCMGKKTSATCDGIEGCSWCGAHCMDERLDCTDITFDQEPTL